MCIIAYAPAGVEIKEEILRKMYRNNRHGVGFMYKLRDDGPVEIRKGLYNEEELIDFYRKIPVDAEKAVHCRIRSRGPIKEGCCHPFPVRENLEDLMAKEDRADVAVMHNGTIESCEPEGGEHAKVSDTMILVTRYLSKWKNQLEDIDIQNKIKDIIGKSRLLIFRKSGKAIMLSEENWHELDGVYYSKKDIYEY